MKKNHEKEKLITMTNKKLTTIHIKKKKKKQKTKNKQIAKR